MIQDQLTAIQRIRLESIAQANMRLGPMLGRDIAQATAELLAVAKAIESFIRGQH